MYKYYLVYLIDSSTKKGESLCRRLDCSFYGNKEHLHGFATKRSMLDWIEQEGDGLFKYQMLKPIT